MAVHDAWACKGTWHKQSFAISAPTVRDDHWCTMSSALGGSIKRATMASLPEATGGGPTLSRGGPCLRFRPRPCRRLSSLCHCTCGSQLRFQKQAATSRASKAHCPAATCRACSLAHGRLRLSWTHRRSIASMNTDGAHTRVLAAPRRLAAASAAAVAAFWHDLTVQASGPAIGDSHPCVLIRASCTSLEHKGWVCWHDRVTRCSH